MKEADPRLIMALQQRLGLPEILAKILVDRDISLEEADSFLTPTLRNLMPDPSHLKDMDKGVALLAEAVEGSIPVAIFGDYDVDGATSSALLSRFLCAAGCPPRIYIPDRFTEGYGPNKNAFHTLAQEGIKIVVTVDCGTMAFEPLEEAAALGLKVVVIDHHVPGSHLPSAHAVINPHRLDDSSPLKNLAAVGLAFLFIVALNRLLRQRGWYTKERPEPDLYEYLDLVALGTVCDVVPLKGLNRAYVAQGLRILHQRRNAGLVALGDLASLNEPPTAYHLGYIYGPRINAGGRVALPSLGSQLLMTNDPLQARQLAATLEEHNKERKAIEAEVLEEAMAQAAASSDPFLILAGHGWHPGIIGIVASRVKERFHKPCCIIGIDETGIGKGSGRSISGLNLGGAIHMALQGGLVMAGGGHSMAAGFTLKEEHISPFRLFMNRHCADALALHKPVLSIDGTLSLKGAQISFVKTLQTLGPFGAGNPTPRFAFRHIQVARADIVGQTHLRIILRGEDGSTLKAMAFRSVGQPLGEKLLTLNQRPFQVAGTLNLNYWKDQESVSLIIEDVADMEN
jgi:single-stranded-DNA-specific exonuclease